MANNSPPEEERKEHETAPDMTTTEEIIKIKKKKKKPSKSKKIALVTLGVVAAVLGIIVGASVFFLNSLNQSMSFADLDSEMALKESLVAEQNEDPYYVLLLGSDARSRGAVSRSDVMILLRVDAATSTLTMVGIPRDTKVEIEGHGTAKINAAYAYGGASGAVEAVSKFAGVGISHYAEIHFEELEELIDMLDGVWVDVPTSNDQTGRTNTGVKLNSGQQLLNGEQALAFARERYGYNRGDYQRNDNQRILLEAIVKKILAAPSFALPGLVGQAASSVTTDYSLSDLVTLATAFQRGGGMTVYSAMVPSHSQTIRGVSYTITESAEWADMMQRVDAGADPNAALGTDLNVDLNPEP